LLHYFVKYVASFSLTVAVARFRSTLYVSHNQSTNAYHLLTQCKFHAVTWLEN